MWTESQRLSRNPPGRQLQGLSSSWVLRLSSCRQPWYPVSQSQRSPLCNNMHSMSSIPLQEVMESCLLLLSEKRDQLFFNHSALSLGGRLYMPSFCVLLHNRIRGHYAQKDLFQRTVSREKGQVLFCFVFSWEETRACRTPSNISSNDLFGPLLLARRKFFSSLQRFKNKKKKTTCC